VRIYTLDPLRDSRWPELLQRHPDASVFHSRGWLETLHRTYGYEPVTYTTSPPGGELANALVFCRIDSWLTGRRLVSLPFSDHSDPLSDSEDTLCAMLGHLERERRSQRWKYIEVRPLRPSAATAGFETSTAFFFHRVDLSPPLHAVFSRFHKGCIQRKIRRAEREGLTYEAGRSEDLLRKFYALLVVTCRRKRLPPQPVEWFRNLVACLGETVTLHVASKGARPIASILTLSFKRSLVYKYGCSDPRFHALGGTQALLWNAIQDAKRRGFVELDLGRSDVEQQGLVTFKNRWGAVSTLSKYLRCSATGARAGQNGALRIARNVFAHMPDRMLIAAGEVLYRHVG
jgi:hypothetical protein